MTKAELPAGDSPAGAWSLDLRSWRIHWSPRARHIHEFSADHPPGVWEALDFIDPQDRTRVFAAGLECVRSGTPMDLEVGLTTAAGRAKRIRLSGFLASDASGPAALKGTMHETSLPDGVAASGDATAQRLLAALREWEIFGRAIPHELASPLSVARGFAEALCERELANLSEKGRFHLTRVLRGLDQLRDLLDALLQFSPLATRPLQREDVNLSAIAEEVVEHLRARDPARTVQVQIQPGMHVAGDRDLLRLAINNLVGNAWKFTRDRADALIVLSRELAGGTTIHRLQDNGVGFDMHDAPRLFTPFERLHERHHFDGSGVGLAMVRRAIERHGGNVWAESCPGEGASFFFTLETA